MTKPALHPWLSTPDAVRAAERAARVPSYKLPAAAQAIGFDELMSEALWILSECALPPRERGHFACAGCGGALENVRAGAKYCSPSCRNRAGVRRFRAGGEAPPPMPPKGHIGSMWSWPEEQMLSYAVREVGMVLCNYARTRVGRSEVPSSQWIETATVMAGIAEPEAREILEDFLVSRGVGFDGTETTDELAEAARWLVKVAA